jgi:riboflavin kinase/FMN adenylyltransferase
MHVANSPETLKNMLRDTPVRLALGNFDGIHEGHRRLIQGLVAKCKVNHEASVVVTFTPHPAEYFGRNHGFKKIDTPPIRQEILRSLGVSGLLELSFDEHIAAMPADEFIKNVLGRLPLREVFVGEDFRFGRDRSGGLDTLKTQGQLSGFAVSAIDIVEIDGLPVSSSRVRQLVAQEGDVKQAAKLLGRPYCLEGLISDGQKIGRSIGFPTANLSNVVQVLPKGGVYAGSLSVVSPEGALSDGFSDLPCVINIGVRPTVTSESKVTIEAHIYGRDGEDLHLYHKKVYLKFHKRIRDEKRFESIDDLKQQIIKDIEAAQK